MKLVPTRYRNLAANAELLSRARWIVEDDTPAQSRSVAALNPFLLMHTEQLHMRWARFQWKLLHVRKHLLWAWVINGTRAVKRAFDVVGSLALLTSLSPVLGLIALLVKCEDGGPILFVQTRVGRFGREFRFYKFRSMCVDAEERLRELMSRNQHADGITFKIKDDPRITRIGKWLRRTSFDELPQLYNVLIGDMSLVGPRPPVPREVARYTLADRRRLCATPGITCIWQVSGRSEIDFSGQVQLDVKYIESQSFFGDLKILLQTIPAVLSGKGAY